MASRRSSPTSAAATPKSSQTPKRSRQELSPKSSNKKGRKKLKTQFIDSSSDEEGAKDDTATARDLSPIKDDVQEMDQDDDDKGAQSPVKAKSRKRVMVLDSDSD